MRSFPYIQYWGSTLSDLTEESIKIVNSLGYVNLKGERVERTFWDFPYTYDPFLLWKDEDYNEQNTISVYSDRLMHWDFEKFNECCQKVFNNTGQYFNNRAPWDIEKFLSLYLEKEIKLTAIEESCNVSSGYPYWIFYYEEKQK